MLKYNCHCSNCRKFAGHDKPFHSGAMCWRWSVVVGGTSTTIDDDDDDNSGGVADSSSRASSSNNNINTDNHLDYEYTTGRFGLFGLARGRCRHCKDCILEKGRRLAAPYAMVLTPPLKDLEPDTDIFYNSGVLVQQSASQKSGTHNFTTTATTGNNRVLYTDLESVLFEIYTVLTSGLVSLPGSLLSRVMYWWHELSGSRNGTARLVTKKSQ